MFLNNFYVNLKLLSTRSFSRRSLQHICRGSRALSQLFPQRLTHFQLLCSFVASLHRCIVLATLQRPYPRCPETGLSNLGDLGDPAAPLDG
jgi:hypothetical protein